MRDIKNELPSGGRYVIDVLKEKLLANARLSEELQKYGVTVDDITIISRDPFPYAPHTPGYVHTVHQRGNEHIQVIFSNDKGSHDHLQLMIDIDLIAEIRKGERSEALAL